MSVLNDSELERLSDLLAQGDMDNAGQIATLLKVELGEQTELAPDQNLQSYFDLLCQIANRR